MRTVQATELKANLSAVLGDVERGERVVVTRHGKTIAWIVPSRERDRKEIKDAIDGIRELKRSLPETGMTVEEMLEARHDGHKY